jgi:hypothetical protein
MKTIRTHDTFYMNENRYDDAKESFKFLAEIMRRKREEIVVRGLATISFSDWGCANGEFPYHLRKVFPKDEIHGYELLPELVAKCRASVPGVEFHEASLLERERAKESEFHVSSANGILGIFDAFEPVLDNLIYWTKPGGAVYLDALFNQYPLDVFIRYNRSEDYGQGILESGWTIFSKASVGKYLAGHAKVAKFAFHDFEIPIDLPPQEDPVRSWTEKTASGSRYITNGLCIIQPQSMLEIHLAE